MTSPRYISALLVFVIGAALSARPAEAQGFLDRMKEAVGNTAKEAVDAAKGTAMEEGMNQAGFLMLAEGAYAGTAAPWVQAGEPVAFAEMPGNAYVSPNRLALVLCQGEGALDGIVFQGNFGAVQSRTDLYLADNAFTVFLVSGGRSFPMRGKVNLAIGKEAVPHTRLMPDLFQRSNIVEIDGNFRASPVESIEQISCGN
jgi:hypothetical protein